MHKAVTQLEISTPGYLIYSMELARLSYVLHKKSSTKLPYLSTAPLAGEGEEAVLYVGQCNASSSSASSAGDAVEGRASMRGVKKW